MMELTSSDVAQLLGIREAQLHRYGDDGKITYRAYGVRRRRRYNIEQLRIAAALNLQIDESLLDRLIERV